MPALWIKMRFAGNLNGKLVCCPFPMGILRQSLDLTALTIGIIGAVNWGLIGFFDFNLVSFLLGSNWLSRIIYAVVGLCGLYLLTFYGKNREMAA